jgi:FeS assembly SUF system protein
MEDQKKEASPTGEDNTSNSPPNIEEGEPGSLRQEIIDVLCTVFDPEIPVNIWELGLVYAIDLDENNNVKVKMTLTSPACPVAGELPPEVENRIKAIDAVNEVSVELVWDPTWNPQMMSEASRLQLGMM